MNNSMVAHLWANEKKESGKGSNLFFEGRSIYPYGYHFEVGRIVRNKCGEKAYLLNDEYYSSHQRCVRSAIPTGSKVFIINNLTGYGDAHICTYNLNLMTLHDLKMRENEINRDKAAKMFACERYLYDNDILSTKEHNDILNRLTDFVKDYEDSEYYETAYVRYDVYDSQTEVYSGFGDTEVESRAMLLFDLLEKKILTPDGLNLKEVDRRKEYENEFE